MTPHSPAGSYGYLQEFVAHFAGDQSLALRPNYSYSLALAALRLELEVSESGRRMFWTDLCSHTMGSMDSYVISHRLSG